MKFNLSFIKKVIPNDTPKPLGRWAIVYCTNQINTKIDFANEDHCGPCGQYNITNKQNDKLITNQTQNLSNRSI